MPTPPTNTSDLDDRILDAPREEAEQLVRYRQTQDRNAENGLLRAVGVPLTVEVAKPAARAAGAAIGAKVEADAHADLRDASERLLRSQEANDGARTAYRAAREQVPAEARSKPIADETFFGETSTRAIGQQGAPASSQAARAEANSLRARAVQKLDELGESTGNLVRDTRAAQIAESTAEAIPGMLDLAGRAAETVGHAAPGVNVAMAIGHEMSQYGDFGHAIRVLAAANGAHGAPLDRLGSSAEGKLKAMPDLLAELHDEGQISESMFNRLSRPES